MADSSDDERTFPWAKFTQRQKAAEPVFQFTGKIDENGVKVFTGDEYFSMVKDTIKMRVVKSKAREGGGWFASGTQLGRYRLVDPEDPDFVMVAAMCEKGQFSSPQEDRAVASFVSMAIGDALGAPMEFSPVNYNDDAPKITGMAQSYHFGLQVGQWTDDASMGACIADSLLWCGGFDPFDMKVRFINWWNFGYANAFRNCKYPKHSVGLGGNISMSFSEFDKNGAVYTRVGDKNTSGNGSVMRNGAIACYYHDNLPMALDVARKQSYMTHQGTEAAECCALLTFICVKAINNPGASVRDILDDLTAFETDCASVACLARSEQEPGNSPDRNWNWKSPHHRYAPTRARQQPGYVGSYAMDALAMALHCVYNTTSYPAALLRAANRCGDADSVTDVTGQVAGAIYGWNAIPRDWIAALNQWDDNDFAVRGVKMFRKLPARYPVPESEAAKFERVSRGIAAPPATTTTAGDATVVAADRDDSSDDDVDESDDDTVLKQGGSSAAKSGGSGVTVSVGTSAARKWYDDSDESSSTAGAAANGGPDSRQPTMEVTWTASSEGGDDAGADGGNGPTLKTLDIDRV